MRFSSMPFRETSMNKKRTRFAAALRSGPAVSIALACVLAAAGTQALAAGNVKAPPQPPGSALVKVRPGMNPDEARRADRAHHHKTGDANAANGQGNRP